MPFNVLATAQARAFAHGQVKLVYSSATQLILTYGNGDLIKINGVWRRLPSGGVAISNAGLSASTVYYVYAYWTGSAVAVEFSTTARATSTAAGNEGVMSKSGDDSRSLVGMVYTNASGQFADQQNARHTRSWFNESGLLAAANSGTTVSTSSTSPIELDAGARCFVLMWTNEICSQTIQANSSHNTGGQATYTSCSINGSVVGNPFAYHETTVNYYNIVGNEWLTASAGDGLATFSMFGWVSAGTASWFNKMNIISTQRR
ncbi:hypothetical protein ACFLEY_22520 [Bradyrhizobium sp. YCK136]|uniref:hypothetical protein n=1 Tax=Bradyrhizobium sp. YCK136 TaxID=3351346 RepID=UPI000765B230